MSLLLACTRATFASGAAAACTVLLQVHKTFWTGEGDFYVVVARGAGDDRAEERVI